MPSDSGRGAFDRQAEVPNLFSLCEVHRISKEFAALVHDERVVCHARHILGSDV